MSVRRIDNHTQEEANQCVYMHISPTGKRYIGRCACPRTRWRSNGSGYKYNSLFWADIQQYGWDNFEHIILAENLDKTTATQLESELIHQYKTIYPENGYNQLTGGKYAGEIAQRHHENLSQKHNEYQPCWVYKGEDARLISKADLLVYEQAGYKLGRGKNITVCVAKGDTMKRIKQSELDSYLQSGWQLGSSAKFIEEQRQRCRLYIWKCDDKEFNNATELTTYLRATYYPTIYISTITSAFNGKPSQKYPELTKLVTRIPVKH